MEITAEQMMQTLNERAMNDPLVKEILRSAAYETVLRLQNEAATTESAVEQTTEKVEVDS